MDTTTHRFRFGLMADRVTTREEVVGSALRAEAVGFSTWLIRDHFNEPAFGHQLGPMATLATVAAVTTRLRIGSLVFSNDHRHPVLLAQEAATLDVLSGGRFELGLGAGFARQEYGSAGIAFDPPRARVDRLEESIAVLKALFADGPATYAGRHYAVEGLDGIPKPVQRPHPPLLVAGNGRRMVGIAAREADILNLMPVTTTSGTVTDDASGRLPAAVEERIDWVRRAAGDRLEHLELSTVMVLRITDHPRRAAETLMRERGWTGVSPEQVLDMPTVFIGTADQIVDLLVERRGRYGFSYYVIPRAEMEDAASIVARVSGM